MHQPPTKFGRRLVHTITKFEAHFHFQHYSTGVNLTFDLLASNLVHITTRQVGNLPTNFGVSRTFLSRLIGQHVSTRHLTLRP